jgi:hypothetical protein
MTQGTTLTGDADPNQLVLHDKGGLLKSSESSPTYKKGEERSNAAVQPEDLV